MFKKLSTGYKIASPGLLAALVCFFLPWVLQSCGNAPRREYSGWQLAMGSGEAGKYTGNFFVFLSLVAIIVLLIFAVQSARRAALKVQDTYGVLLTSVLVLLFLFQQFLTTAPKGVNRELLYGLWGYILGWLLVLIGGVVNLVEQRGGNRQA
jgi:hypothetical protein